MKYLNHVISNEQRETFINMFQFFHYCPNYIQKHPILLVSQSIISIFEKWPLNWKRRRSSGHTGKEGGEGAGRKIARLWLRVTGWRGSLRPRPPFTDATARRSCRVLMRYTIAWWLLNKKYESKMAAFARRYVTERRDLYPKPELHTPG